MTGLVIVPPLAITTAMVTASDVPETDYTAWSGATTYVGGDRVINTTVHKVYEAIDSSVGSTVTISNGLSSIPGDIGWVGHGLVAGTPVVFSTTGTLPTGLSPGTTYYVHSPHSEGFWVAASVGGTPINTGSAGTGVHSCSASVNLNRDPTNEDHIGIYWLEVSPTNKWKLFDNSSSTQTARATSFYYEITPGEPISAVYAAAITGATSIRVRLTDPIYGVVFDQTTDLSAVPAVASWWHWFFGARSGGTQAIHVDVPAYPNAVLRVDLAGGSDLAIGVLVIGRGTEFGHGIRLGPRASIQDYSRKETNEFGDLELVERAFSKRLQCVLRMSNTQLDELMAYLAGVRATPCLYVAYDGFATTIIHGFYKSLETLIAYQTFSECALDLEGLT